MTAADIARQEAERRIEHALTHIGMSPEVRAWWQAGFGEGAAFEHARVLALIESEEMVERVRQEIVESDASEIPGRRWSGRMARAVLAVVKEAIERG